MSDYSLLFDVARARQQETAREVEMTRISRDLRRNMKSTSLAKKLRTFLAAKM
jgi:hypothetical protein